MRGGGGNLTLSSFSFSLPGAESDGGGGGETESGVSIVVVVVVVVVDLIFLDSSDLALSSRTENIDARIAAPFSPRYVCMYVVYFF